MQTTAVVLERPGELTLRRLELRALGAADIVVDIDYSGISTGTERMLWAGTMPSFPGMGYPLVPGYESIGRVVAAGPSSADRVGDLVFVPGADCYIAARGLFGGAARRVVLPQSRALTVDPAVGRDGVLLALAATAYHAIAGGGVPDLIVGHGVLGRLLARLAVTLGGSPVVWETCASRRGGAAGYNVIDPADDPRHDYAATYDVSGATEMLDALIGRSVRGSEITLAGFYTRLGFDFAPAFRKEVRIRVAAEFTPADLAAIVDLVEARRLSLSGIITHEAAAVAANDAYPIAFGDSACLKMVLDWRDVA